MLKTLEWYYTFIIFLFSIYYIYCAMISYMYETELFNSKKYTLLFIL